MIAPDRAAASDPAVTFVSTGALGVLTCGLLLVWRPHRSQCGQQGKTRGGCCGPAGPSGHSRCRRRCSQAEWAGMLAGRSSSRVASCLFGDPVVQVCGADQVGVLDLTTLGGMVTGSPTATPPRRG